MKKLFRTLLAVSFLASAPSGDPRRFNIVNQLPVRIKLVGSGKPDLTRLTVKDLRKMATTMKIKGRSKARRKADLVALIRKNGGAL